MTGEAGVPVSEWNQFRNATSSKNRLAPTTVQNNNTPTNTSGMDYGFSSYGSGNNGIGALGTADSNQFGKGLDFGDGGDKKPTNYTNVMQGIDAVSGLANAYLGFKNLRLSKKQFQFTKDSFNTNLANQATLTNEEVVAREVARLSATGQYNQESDLRDRAVANVTERNALVSGAPV